MPDKKKLPPEALDVSVALLHLRHAAEDRATDKIPDAFNVVYQAIELSMPAMKALGFKKMQYAGAMLLLHEAQGDTVHVQPWRIMAAHESLRQALKDAGIAEPTDDEIIAHARSSAKLSESDKARIAGNFR